MNEEITGKLADEVGYVGASLDSARFNLHDF
jgi:hypothetical protein